LYLAIFIIGLCGLVLGMIRANALTCEAIGAKMQKPHDIVAGQCMVEVKPGEWMPLQSLRR
jgi:hypothetical protein